MPTKEEALAELYKRGVLTDRQKSVVEELSRRGVVNLQPTVEEDKQAVENITSEGYRQEAMKELAQEIGPLQSFLIGAGKGFYNVGRGLHLIDPSTESEQMGLEALKEERPYTTGAGEILGEAAPFLIPGAGVGRVASTGARLAATGALGATEGAIIAEGTEGDALEGAGVGGAIGVSAELLFPVIGRLGRKIFQKVKGVAPRGAIIDAAGKPTQEFSDALQEAGMSFEDLTEDAANLVTAQKPGADPEQVARAAMFRESGVPATKGEITQDFAQQATEQRLLETAEDKAAEPLRQFKLKQSEAVKASLRDVFGQDVGAEETGQAIKDVLEGRKKALRTQKNELYNQAAEAGKDVGSVPIFTDKIKEVLPDDDLLEDLAITAPQSIRSLDQILTKYGLKEPTEEMTEAGFTPTPLTVKNFERFRKTLNAISKGDQTGAAGVAINPIKNALDSEVDELATVLERQGVDKSIIEPLSEARQTVRQLKTEFSPQSVVGNITGVKKDGVTPIVEASKVYDKIASRAAPVENVRKLVKSLSRSPQGDQALASLQATTILDLIDAGFGTESRKISGVKTFNPIAFKRRLNNIGMDKVNTIFKNNKASLKKLKNIEKIASELVPPSGAVPKGSASVILDLMNSLGLAGISTKIPGGALLVGAAKKIAEPVKTGMEVSKALAAEPDVTKVRSMFDDYFPGIASAISIPAAIEDNE